MASRISADKTDHRLPPIVKAASLGRTQATAKPPVAPWSDELPVWVAINQLTREDLCQLERFGERLLIRFQLPLDFGKDLVQQALFRVLAGMNGGPGRHPKPDDLADRGSFLSYLKGAIRSMVDTERELLENRFRHESWDEEIHSSGSAVAAVPNSVDQEVAFQDFSNLLYKRLSCRAPGRLRMLLTAWKDQQFASDNIPLQGCHRRLRAELRALAVDVVNEINHSPNSLANAPTPLNPNETVTHEPKRRNQ